ncbi:sigma factor-like helix-turn-helix DNA-binding protein [Solibacillus sp. FSL R7-0682]|uniref:sigma factor-like helix-turn-helix DNA-binding protein n=1 Tax=Solibacillus sp. FSL R7-0682 TaxID=2921690 RepID=UPI0030FC58F3
MYFEDLLEEYKQLLKQMKSEGVTSGSMYQEVKQAIEWMETGYDPAEYRAATRVDSYPMDPYHMQTYMSYVNDDEMMMPEFLVQVREKIKSDYADIDVDAPEWQSYIAFMMRDVNAAVKKANERKEKISSALKGLTVDERAVYVAIEAELLPFSKVAKMLEVSKSTIQSYYSRAKRKIHANITHGTQESLFDDIA